MSTLVEAGVSEFEIEEHVAEHNRFFQTTGLTLDDLEVYSEPLGTVSNAIRACSLGFMQKADAFAIFLQAVEKFAAIDTQLDQRYKVQAA